MNYPIWDVAFGSGLLIALISIVHVFVSHFAIGGGLFLVVTELRAYRTRDAGLLEWLIRHTRFFVLVSVVFGALTGVGIWFTIGLVHPSGTSALIRSYVWAWAIEWLFFFIEITAALMYFYGWKTLDRKTHLWIGWIYFGSAFLSMVVINGIVTFMLTPGRWLETKSFWDGFLNPTYLPSLGLRFAFSLALAGVYAMLTGSRDPSPVSRARIISWSARWIIPSFLVLPAFAYWYIWSIDPQIWASAQGRMPTASRYALVIVFASAIALLGSLLAALRPARFSFLMSLAVFLAAFATMWSFEFIRESIRKPYVIYGYMYSNSIFTRELPPVENLTVGKIRELGVLNVAGWTRHKSVSEDNALAAGREIFRLECQSCHTIGHYRSIRGLIRARNWDFEAIHLRLGSLDKMVNGVMPPFAGTAEEKQALARFLASLNPDIKPAQSPLLSGQTIFESHCSGCHAESPDDALFTRTQKLDESALYEVLAQLDSLNPDMPPFSGTEEERKVLAKWIADR